MKWDRQHDVSADAQRCTALHSTKLHYNTPVTEEQTYLSFLAFQNSGRFKIKIPNRQKILYIPKSFFELKMS